MTCRVKLALECPECVGDQFEGGCYNCPSRYGYAGKPEYCRGPGNESLCKCCWDRGVEDMNLNLDRNEAKNCWEMPWLDEDDNGNKNEEGRQAKERAILKDGETGVPRYKEWLRNAQRYVYGDQAIRHLQKHMDGQTDEDHLIAAFWNICGLAWADGKTKKLVEIMERYKNADA